MSGIKIRPQTQIEVRRRLRKGETPGEVADVLNISVASVYRHKGDMDLKLLAELNRISADDKEKWLAYMAEKMPTTLKRVYGCSDSYIRKLQQEGAHHGS